MRSFNKRMSENNSREGFLKAREVLNETLLRDVFIFIILYLFVLSQSWTNIFLLLFPIITFGFSLFFRVINSNKYRIILDLECNLITYNPLGLEKKHANRLNFTALLQLVLLFWIGAESYYHPQLIQTYDLFFNLFFIFFFTFGFYWILIDIWKYAKISIRIKKNNGDKTVSCLNQKHFNLISIINLITFILLNVLNISFVLTLDNNAIFGFQYELPGTGIENSLPLKISILPFIIIWISPIVTSLLLLTIYKDLNNIIPTKLINSFEELPEEIRIFIIRSFGKINRKYNRDLNNE
jgi:hypothetical protein